MGKKPHPDSGFIEFLCDQLANLPEMVTVKPMFGGHGLYLDTRFFAIVGYGRVYFKTNYRTRPKYEAHGMDVFKPSEKQVLKHYLEVPVDILEDADTLCQWAEEASHCELCKSTKI